MNVLVKHLHYNCFFGGWATQYVGNGQGTSCHHTQVVNTEPYTLARYNAQFWRMSHIWKQGQILAERVGEGGGGDVEGERRRGGEREEREQKKADSLFYVLWGFHLTEWG